MIQISDMAKEDLESVVRIEKECFSLPWSYTSLEETIENKNARYIVLKENNTVCGYIGMWYGGDEAEITNVAVTAAYRQRGFGKMLLEAAYDTAKQDGMTRLFLEVRAGNEPAKGLYLGFGFSQIGIRKNFYVQPDEDALVMKKNIEG